MKETSIQFFSISVPQVVPLTAPLSPAGPRLLLTGERDLSPNPTSEELGLQQGAGQCKVSSNLLTTTSPRFPRMPSLEGALRKGAPSLRFPHSWGGARRWRRPRGPRILRPVHPAGPQPTPLDFCFPALVTLFLPCSKGAGRSWAHPGRMEPDGPGHPG